MLKLKIICKLLQFSQGYFVYEKTEAEVLLQVYFVN